MNKENVNITKNENGVKFKAYMKITATTLQRSLQAFSNNIFIKSLVSGFVSTMPVILVSSIFILLYSLPEAISPDYLGDGKDASFNMFKAFCVRTYQFSYGIIGLLVTGNICRAMGEELNTKLPYNNRIKTFNLLIAGMIIYFVMSAITVASNGGDFDMSANSWFDSVNWTQMGAQGMLPGIIIGLTTPWIFYWCYKYNITIRMPKAVPGVISQSFLSIIPFGISLLIWSAISFGFIVGLKQPFVPWFFEQLSGFIPKGISQEEWEEAIKNGTEEALINQTLSAFSNSYGMIFLFRFLETFSWFIGVHPEAIQGVFEGIMFINQEMNQTLAELGRNESIAFVNSLMGPTGGIGGTGATFVFPIICLLFAKSEQLKVAGKTSVIPTSFQVNEPILFGAPIILNPYFFLPFILVPMANSAMAKVFVDHFGMRATSIDLPWAIPSIIRLPLAHNGQWQSFLLLLIVIGISFFFYLPFVMLYDRALVREEIKAVGEENYFSINGIQYQLNKYCYYDFEASNKFKKEWKKALEEYPSDLRQFKIAKQELANDYKNKLAETKMAYVNDIDKLKESKENLLNDFKIKLNKLNDDYLEKRNKSKEIKNELINEYKNELKKANQNYSNNYEELKKVKNEIIKKYIHEPWRLDEKFINNKIKLKEIKFNLIKQKKENTAVNLTNLFIKIRDEKIKKEISNFQDKIQFVDKKISDLKEKQELYNARIETKIENYELLAETSGLSFDEKIENLKSKIKNEPKNYVLKKDFKGQLDAKLMKINSEFEIKALKIKQRVLSEDKKDEIIKIKETLKNEKELFSTSRKEENLLKANEILSNHQNPYKDIDLSSNNKEEKTNTKNVDQNKTYNVLVLCIGAGTSAMLANAISEGAKNQSEIKLVAKALAYDSYKEALKDTDLIITSPQLRSYLSSIQSDADQHSIKVAPTKGKQYIDLTNNSEDAFNFAVSNLFGIDSDKKSKLENKKEEKNNKIVGQKENKTKDKTYNVLVLCIGAGTSAMLANAISEGAKNQNEIKLVAKALAYDSYKEALKDTDLIITSPQLRSYLSSIQSDADQHSIKVAPTKGKQYIDLTNNPNDAFKFALENLKIDKDN